MPRRDVVAGFMIALAAPRVAAAQPRKVYRIGVLGFSPATAAMTGPQPTNPFVAAFLRGMSELGHVYGEHFVTEPRGAEGRIERYPDFAGELVRGGVDVIVAVAAALPALKQATTTIPIVMAGYPDPVGLGFVQSLGRPGGNITGLSLQSIELTAKRLELLKELVPGVSRIAALWNPTNPNNAARIKQVEAAAKTLHLTLESFRSVGNRKDLDKAFEGIVAARSEALIMESDRALLAHRALIVEFAKKRRLPALYAYREFVQVGGLASYAPSYPAMFRRAATYVDKILKGAKPGDLPIEQPTNLSLVLNLKTAKTLGLTIPTAVRQRADGVIE